MIGLVWGVAGLMMTAIPTVWRASLYRMLNDPGPRFVVTQCLVLAGLVLVVGTNGFQGYWLWVVLGLMGVAVGCFLLGCSSIPGVRLVSYVDRWPLWLYRLCGIMMISLAVLFSTDLILYGS